MPPWPADPLHGQFRNDARLTAEEKELLCRWIDDGCPEGDARELPGVPRFADGWRIPKPDLVLHMAERPYRVPAEGEVEYQYFEVDSGFTEDRWVKAAEIRLDLVLRTGKRNWTIVEIQRGVDPQKRRRWLLASSLLLDQTGDAALDIGGGRGLVHIDAGEQFGRIVGQRHRTAGCGEHFPAIHSGPAWPPPGGR